MTTTPATGSAADAFAAQRLDLLKQAGVDMSKVDVAQAASTAERWRTVSAAVMPELQDEAHAAGYTHVLDFLQAGAKAHKLPAAGSRTEGAYETPTQVQQARLKAYEASGLSEADAKAKIHATAKTYAQAQLGRLEQVAPGLKDDELKKALGQDDPFAAWRDASGRFAKLADAAGYADPRTYLKTLEHGAPAQPAGPAASPAPPAPTAGNTKPPTFKSPD